MTFAPDTVEALESSVHLANSALAPDTLTTIEALQEFYVRFAYTGAAPTAADLEPVRAIRPRLRALFVADRDDAVTLVNAILAEQGAVPQLTRHGDTDWHIHATTDDRQPTGSASDVEGAAADPVEASCLSSVTSDPR